MALRRAAAASAAALLLAGAAACERGRSPASTAPQARPAGSVDPAWIPEWVPPGATGIEEAHDLDTGRQRLKFGASPAEIEALRSALPRLHISLLCPSRHAPRLSGAWPAGLEEGAAFWTHRYLRGTTRSGTSLVVAVEGATSTVYAWSCEKPIPER